MKQQEASSTILVTLGWLMVNFHSPGASLLHEQPCLFGQSAIRRGACGFAESCDGRSDHRTSATGGETIKGIKHGGTAIERVNGTGENGKTCRQNRAVTEHDKNEPRGVTMSEPAYKFDPLAYADFLTEKGCQPELAKAQAGEMVKIIDFLQVNASVSKKDIQAIEALTRQKAQTIRHEIAETHKEIATIHQKIAELDAKTQKSIAVSEAKTLEKIADLEAKTQEKFTEAQLQVAKLQRNVYRTRFHIISWLGSLMVEILGVGFRFSH